MKYILATKEKMTQIFAENGNVVPATLVNAGPVFVAQVKNKEKDGYDAIKFGFIKRKGTSKKKEGFMHVKELRIKDTKDAGDLQTEKGKEIDLSVFSEGDKIVVSGISKSKGFQGVVKRHGFKGGSRTHGQKHSEREPGAIGGGGRAGGEVRKGMRMAGRMGGDRITIKNLKVIKIDKENNQLLISGAIPGRKGTLLEIKG